MLKGLINTGRLSLSAVFFMCISYCSYGDELIIGVEDVPYYPYFDFKAQGPSFSKELLDQFANDSGYTITYLPLPIKQFAKWLYEENIDFKFPDNPRWLNGEDSRQKDIYFSDEVVRLRAGTVTLSKHQHKEADFFKNIGTITGFLPTQWFEQIEQGRVQIVEDTSPKILVKQLVNNIVDGLDIDLAVANHYLQELKLEEKLVINHKADQQIFSYQLSSLKYPLIIEQFNRWLVTNQAFIVNLKQKYGILAVEPRFLGVRQ